MKRIPTQNIRLNNAYRITDLSHNQAIWRIGLDQYAITVEWSDEPVFAFESEEFSVLINSLECEIEKFTAIKNHCLMCNADHTFHEVRIQTVDGHIFYIDTNESTALVIEQELKTKGDKSAYTPMEMWHLPDEAPYNSMLITNSLIRELEKYISSTNAAEVISHIWSETHSTRDGPLVDQVLNVECEFCSFAVTEFKCGRHIFMAPSDATTET